MTDSKPSEQRLKKHEYRRVMVATYPDGREFRIRRKRIRGIGNLFTYGAGDSAGPRLADAIAKAHAAGATIERRLLNDAGYVVSSVQVEA